MVYIPRAGLECKLYKIKACSKSITPLEGQKQTDHFEQSVIFKGITRYLPVILIFISGLTVIERVDSTIH